MIRFVIPVSVNVPLSSSTHNKSEQPGPQEMTYSHADLCHQNSKLTQFFEEALLALKHKCEISIRAVINDNIFTYWFSSLYYQINKVFKKQKMHIVTTNS